MSEKEMSLLGHLEELRWVIIKSLLSLIPGFAIGWYFRETIMQILLKPLLDINPNFKPIVLKPTDVFFVYVKIAFVTGIVLASPYIIYQIWSFIEPALKPHEKKIVGRILPAAVLLFFTGLIFAYFTVFKIGTVFFWGFGGEAVAPMYGMQEYWNFTLAFLLPFGLVFELPIVVSILAKLGLVTPEFLKKNRKFAILLIFVIAAFLTPGPDIISQLLMAAPMIILYEISIWLARIVKPINRFEEEEVQ